MSNLITLQIEGTPSHDGHILLTDFIDRIDNLLTALNGIDKIVGDTSQPTLNYRIVNATHSSPLTFTFEPEIKERVTKPDAQHIEKRHRRFFSELYAISRGLPVSPDIDEPILESLQRLAEGAGQQFSSARLYNTDTRVELDAKFESSLRSLLDEEDASYGSEEGTLDRVNIHGTKRTCWIYPKIGPQKIRCEFLPGTRELIKENLGKYVRVEGIKYFRANSPFPFRMAVREIEVMTPDDGEVYLKDLQGISPDATGELSAVDFIRKIRDEWD